MNNYGIEGLTTFEFTKIIGIENFRFGTNIIIDDFVMMYAKASVNIGSYVHIAAFSSVVASAEFKMGDFSGLSQGCRILTATDDFKDWGFGNPTLPEKYRNIRRQPVEIGKFAIVGTNTVVLPGVHIGEGASVGANSVVTRDLEPWGIYIGNKRVKDRNRDAVMRNYDCFLKERAHN